MCVLFYLGKHLRFLIFSFQNGGNTTVPDKTSLELLCQGCSGDIRSAINSLQFSSSKGNYGRYILTALYRWLRSLSCSWNEIKLDILTYNWCIPISTYYFFIETVSYYMCIHACTDPYEYVFICIYSSETRPDSSMWFAAFPLKVRLTSWVKT